MSYIWRWMTIDVTDVEWMSHVVQIWRYDSRGRDWRWLNESCRTYDDEWRLTWLTLNEWVMSTDVESTSHVVKLNELVMLYTWLTLNEFVVSHTWLMLNEWVMLYTTDNWRDWRWMSHVVQNWRLTWLTLNGLVMSTEVKWVGHVVHVTDVEWISHVVHNWQLTWRTLNELVMSHSWMH